MTKWQTKLVGLDACPEAVDWAKDYKTFPSAWKACERGDWMFWLSGRLKIKRGTLVLALVKALRPICLKHSKDKRVAECLDVCERWANGKATLDEVRTARADAAAAAAAYYSSAAAAAAADAAAAAAAAADAAYYSAYAAAAAAAADAAYYSAYAAAAAAAAAADAYYSAYAAAAAAAAADAAYSAYADAAAAAAAADAAYYSAYADDAAAARTNAWKLLAAAARKDLTRAVMAAWKR